MADNVTADPGSGGATFRTLEDGSSNQWPVSVIAEATTIGTPNVLQIRTAAALADATANPTVVLGASCFLVFNGATWDRLRGDTTTGLYVGGAVAHDAADSGNPSKIGGRARTTAITAVATDDRVDAIFSTTGGQMMSGSNAGVPTDMGVDGSGHVQCDIAAASVNVTVDLNSVTPDLMLGTDFSNVLGTASLVLATQADDVANTSDGVQTSSFLYVFDGTTWDRLRGDSTDGVLVNLGSNNDVTVTGTVTVGAVTPDLMLGTDFSDVLGTASLILATQADDVANTSDGLQTSSFCYVFDGTTWDRLRGDSTDGMLVNLGTNNDVTVTGNVTADLGANNDIQGDVAHDATDSGNPLKIGGKAETTIPTAVADGDRVDAWFSESGALGTFGEPFTTTGSASANDTDLVSVDCARYRSVSFFTDGTFNATITWQVSNDNVTWDTVFAYRADQSTPDLRTSNTSADIWHSANIPTRYFRIRTTAYTSGTVNVRCHFSAFPYDPPYLVVGGGSDHDETYSNPPMPAGFFASSTQPANVSASGDMVHGWATLDGAQVVKVFGSFTAHDAVDAGNPVKIGMKAVNVGATPTAVAAADRTDALATREGQLITIAGHPNIVSREYVATGAQTDSDMLGAVSAGSRVVVTGIEALVDADTSVNVKVRIGFGAANVPTEPTNGNSVAGMVLVHPDIAPGSGVIRGTGSGILAVGGDGEELRITCDEPTSGQLTCLVTYFVISA